LACHIKVTRENQTFLRSALVLEHSTRTTTNSHHNLIHKAPYGRITS